MRQRLERMGLSPLEFDGDLIISAASKPMDVAGDSANYRLLVFRRTSGSGFVASIEYVRTGAHERRVHLSEELETYHDVENFFFVFEPEEYCSKQELTNHRGLDQDELLRKLYGYYNEQVQGVVAQLRALERDGALGAASRQEAPSNSHSPSNPQATGSSSGSPVA